MFDLEGVTQARTDGGRRVLVLRNVSLRLPAGEFVAVNGPAGAGKSALVRILAGLERPLAGSVKLGEEDLAAMTDKRLAQVRSREIGLVCDPPDVRPGLTVEENAELTLARLGVAAASRRCRATAALASVGLADRARRSPGRFSRADRQRVALARALAAEPRVLVAEEPAEDVMTLLEGLWRERGITLVVTTRDARIAARAPRVLALLGGELREQALARVA